MNKADFLNSPTPEPIDLPDLDLHGPGRFYNRELSWLGFNWRVLGEAQNQRVPLLERLRFLSISATNLDEFYNVRVAGLRELAHAGNTTPADDGLTPAEQLVLINENARRLLDAQQETFETLRREMEDENISILDAGSLTDTDRAYLGEMFLNKVFPVLSPLANRPGASVPTSSPTWAIRSRSSLSANPTSARFRRCCPFPSRSTASSACPQSRAFTA